MVEMIDYRPTTPTFAVELPVRNALKLTTPGPPAPFLSDEDEATGLGPATLPIPTLPLLSLAEAPLAKLVNRFVIDPDRACVLLVEGVLLPTLVPTPVSIADDMALGSPFPYPLGYPYAARPPWAFWSWNPLALEEGRSGTGGAVASADTVGSLRESGGIVTVRSLARGTSMICPLLASV